MFKLWVKRVGQALLPSGDESIEEFEKVPVGTDVEISIRQPRSAAHLRLYWALCARIGNAKGIDSEIVSDMLKIATGYCEIIQSRKYGQLRLPRSISFAAMDQIQFADFFRKCVDTIYTEWEISPSVVSDLLIPEWTEPTAEAKAEAPDELLEEINGYMFTLKSLSKLEAINDMDATVKARLKEADRADLLPAWNHSKLAREKIVRGLKT